MFRMSDNKNVISHYFASNLYDQYVCNNEALTPYQSAMTSGYWPNFNPQNSTELKNDRELTSNLSVEDKNGQQNYKQSNVTLKITKPSKSRRSDSPSKSPRKRLNRFDGQSEEDVAKKFLPDHIKHGLDILIIGINPGLFAAHKGHHYAGPGNHFWKCLYLSGFTSDLCTALDDYKMLDVGIGFTNVVARTTRGSADLSKKEIQEGCKILLSKLQYYRPKVAVFNGKGIYEVFCAKKDFLFGKQPETVPETDILIWVMPSSSARCAQLPRAADKVPFYAALKKLRDSLRGDAPPPEEGDLVFEKLKSPVKKEKIVEGGSPILHPCMLGEIPKIKLEGV